MTGDSFGRPRISPWWLTTRGGVRLHSLKQDQTQVGQGHPVPDRENKQRRWQSVEWIDAITSPGRAG
jgi:hypothetical protein